MKLKRKLSVTIKNALGLPVKYTTEEFRAIKAKQDIDSIPQQRVSILANVLQADEDVVKQYIAEAEAIEVDKKRDPDDGGFQGVGNPMGRMDRITLYTSLRVTKPKVVVETGTAAGASSLYIMSALAKNGAGVLHSIDATKDRTNVGRLVPDHLRENYNLYAGNSLEVLDEIFGEDSIIDFFLHDSLHTYEHMQAEFEWAWRHAKGQSILCSHDVLMGNVWNHFVKRHRISKSGIIKNFGVCVVKR